MGYLLMNDHIWLFLMPLLEVTGNLKYIGAGLASISFVGAGVGQGAAGAKAVDALARNPELENKIRNFFILAAAITESGAIYGLVVAMILIFVV